MDKFVGWCPLDDNAKIKVIVADPHPVLRGALREHIDRHAVCEVVAEAGDVKGALYACATHDHNVILINFAMSIGDITATIAEFRNAFQNSQLVVGHLPASGTGLKQLWEMNVSGFLSPMAEPAEYSAAIVAASGGGHYLSAHLAKAVFCATDENAAREQNSGLTSRELEVLKLLANGYCNKEIANINNISVRTVETHRLNIRRKTGANTLSDLVRKAQEFGIRENQHASYEITQIQPLAADR